MVIEVVSDESNDAMWDRLWQEWERSKALLNEFGSDSPQYQAHQQQIAQLVAQHQDTYGTDTANFARVMDPSLSAQERIQAAMAISDRPQGRDDSPAVERFFSNMFSEVSQDGNIENDRDEIRAVETALNGLVVNGVTIRIEADGVADRRLVSLLRNPEVAQALEEALSKDTAAKLHFTADYQGKLDRGDDESLRLHNMCRPREATGEREV